MVTRKPVCAKGGRLLGYIVRCNHGSRFEGVKHIPRSELHHCRFYPRYHWDSNSC